MSAEHLFEAIGHVGADLVDSAQHTVPAAKPWRSWVCTAALIALLIGAAALALPELGTANPPDLQQPADTVQARRGTIVLNGKIYYVDTCEEPLTQKQLNAAIAGDALTITPDRASTAELEQAEIYPSSEEDLLILALEDGLHTALTYGEIYGIEFGYDIASASSNDTLLRVFVLPVENCFAWEGLRFSNPAELNDGQLLLFFRAMILARDAAGVRALEIESQMRRTEHGNWAYSAQEMRQILDQYLSGHCFSLYQGVLDMPITDSIGTVFPVLRKAEFLEASKQMVLQVDIYEDETYDTLLRESTYTIQFTGNHYRYLSILDRRPDQMPEDGISAPTNPAD